MPEHELPGHAAGQWGTTANLGLGLATFDMMAQLLSHPLVDVAHLWTTRWRTSYPGSYSGASNFEALTARPPLSALRAAAQWAPLLSRTHAGLAPRSMLARPHSQHAPAANTVAGGTCDPVAWP